MSSKIHIDNGWDFQIVNHWDYPNGIPTMKQIKGPTQLDDLYQKSSGFKAWKITDGDRVLVASILKEGHLMPGQLGDPDKLQQRNNLQTKLLREMGWFDTKNEVAKDAIWDKVGEIYNALKLSPGENFINMREHWDSYPSQPLLAQTVKIRFGRIMDN